jgi:hypothetical protein
MHHNTPMNFLGKSAVSIWNGFRNHLLSPSSGIDFIADVPDSGHRKYIGNVAEYILWWHGLLSEDCHVWDDTLCFHQWLSLQPPAHAGSSLADFSTLKMEAICSSETSVHTRSTRPHISEDRILLTKHSLLKKPGDLVPRLQNIARRGNRRSCVWQRLTNQSVPLISTVLHALDTICCKCCCGVSNLRHHS